MASVCERVPPPSTKPTKSYSLTPRRSDKDEMQNEIGERGRERGRRNWSDTHVAARRGHGQKRLPHLPHDVGVGAGADSELARCH